MKIKRIRYFTPEIERIVLPEKIYRFTTKLHSPALLVSKQLNIPIKINYF